MCLIFVLFGEYENFLTTKISQFMVFAMTYCKFFADLGCTLYFRISSLKLFTIEVLSHTCTGKGPLKAHYEELIEKKKLQVVTVSTMWLASEDYPALLGHQ